MTRAGLVPALAALPLLALLTGCGGGVLPQAKAVAPSSAAAGQGGDPAVEVVGLPDGQRAEVTDAETATLPREHIAFVSPVYDVTPAGTLPAPVVVRLRLDNAVPRSTPVFVATRTSGSGSADPSASPSSTSSTDASAGAQPGESWTWNEARLTSDHRHVEFTTTRLGAVGAVTVDVAPVRAALQGAVRSGLTSRVDGGTQAPTCLAGDAATADGYAVQEGSGSTLATCFGVEDGQRVLKVTNRRTVPVEVSHPDLTVVPGSTTVTPTAWLAWATALDGARPAAGSSSADRTTVLAPGGSAAYAVDLDPSSEATVSATSGQRAVSLRVLRAASRAVADRLELFGTGTADADRLLATLVAEPACASALDDGAAALVRGCLSTGVLERALGDRTRLLAPVLDAGTTRSFLRAQVAAVTRQVADQERQEVVVRRGAPDFAALAGRFTAPERSLTIGAGGLATERVTDGPGTQVIDLTYQLADPTTQNGTTTAAATLTRVTLYDRALFSGRIPQVGDTGTLTLTRGVVTPPYLSTSYCDAAAGQRNACGS